MNLLTDIEPWMLIPSDFKGVAGYALMVVVLTIGILRTRRERAAQRGVIPQFKSTHIERA